MVKTDPNGVATFALPEAGWWGIAAEVEGGRLEVNGQSLPAVYRATYWVNVARSERE